MVQLSTSEINAILQKIRSKYELMIKEFKKSRILVENFDDRYIDALKSKNDISVFLLAEVEVVEELYNRELKKYNEEFDKELIEKAKVEKKSFADKVMEENLNKIAKYTRYIIGPDAAVELERLLGATRDLLNDYWPAMIIIYRNAPRSWITEKLDSYYDKLMISYDYKDEMPIIRRYKDDLSLPIRNLNKIDYEYRYVFQETAFLFNDMLDIFDAIIANDDIPNSQKKMSFPSRKPFLSSLFRDSFTGLTHKEAVSRIRNFIDCVINDFRIKGFKKV